jgi:predicted ATP-grasp superfamily ATP-dependent carboligase
MESEMKIFLYEWSCAEVEDEYVKITHLGSEGKAMFLSVAEDILAIGHSIGTICHTNYLNGIDKVDCQITNKNTLFNQFQQCARSCDVAIIIAPEFDNILADRIKWLENTNCKNLGSTIDSVKLTSDKLALCKYWQTTNVPSIATWENTLDVNNYSGFIIKPRYGAGTCNTQYIMEREDIDFAMNKIIASGSGPLVIQPYHVGIPISISALISRENHSMTFMPACSQSIRFKGNQLEYDGGTCPLEHHLQQRAINLSIKAISGIAGLSGWIGIDMIIGNNLEDSQDVVVEINPRLTTSYIGIRHIVKDNLMECWFNPTYENRQLELKHGIIGVTWLPDGTVNLLEGS